MIVKKVSFIIKVVSNMIILIMAISMQSLGDDVIQSEIQWAQKASIIELLAADCDPTIYFAKLELLRRGEQAKKEIIDLLRSGNLNKDLSVRAVTVLAQLFHAKEAASYARKLIWDEDTFVRIAAIYALRIVGDNSDVPMLIALMKDDDPFVAIEAIRSLGEIGDVKALHVLRERLKQPRSEIEFQEIKKAVRKIEIINSPNRNKELIELIQTDDIFLALWAIKKVGELKITEAKNIMRQLLKTSKDRRVKVSVLKALKDIGEVLTPEEEQLLKEHPLAIYGF